MPKFDWQLIVALLALAGAAWFLIRRALRTLRSANKSSPACESCNSCAATKNPPATPAPGFVPLDSLTRHDNQ